MNCHTRDATCHVPAHLELPPTMPPYRGRGGCSWLGGAQEQEE